MTSVAICQPSYIPWRGYFDMISSVDEFIFLDDVQYTRRDWRNRNYIKGPDGLQRLSIPVRNKGQYSALINQVRVVDDLWRSEHLRSLRHAYSRSPFFSVVYPFLEGLYQHSSSNYLSSINVSLIEGILRYLGVSTGLTMSSSFSPEGVKGDRIFNLCLEVGASVYLTGPSARDYLVEDKFNAAGIEVRYMDYSLYPEYTQQWGAFEGSVSIVDLLFNCGADSIFQLRQNMC